MHLRRRAAVRTLPLREGRTCGSTFGEGFASASAEAFSPAGGARLVPSPLRGGPGWGTIARIRWLRRRFRLPRDPHPDPPRKGEGEGTASLLAGAGPRRQCVAPSPVPRQFAPRPSPARGRGLWGPSPVLHLSLRERSARSAGRGFTASPANSLNPLPPACGRRPPPQGEVKNEAKGPIARPAIGPPTGRCAVWGLD